VTLTPLLIDGYTAKRAANHAVHQILGTNELAVTLREAGLRAGDLRLLVETYADAGLHRR
jgi:hypothetical protein